MRGRRDNSTAHARFKREPSRLELRERHLQLFQLRRRTMQFQPDEIGHRQHLREQHADVVEMRENAFGIGVTFATENFVAVNGESVEKIFFSVAAFSMNCGNFALTTSSFPGRTLKYG